MWVVTTQAVAQLPGEEITQINTIVAKLASEGTTSPDPIIEGMPLPSGLGERQRSFTTLAAAEEYADVINNLPSDLVNVTGIEQLV